MNIIITKNFKKDFNKIFKWSKDIVLFSLKLKKTQIINLDYPFKKYKFSFLNINVRWILIFEINNNYLPIFIVKKSDKKSWMNLIITNSIKKILELNYLKAIENIKNWDFEIL